MARKIQYYTRGKSGPKGPYSAREMKESIEGGALSAGAEYRTGADEEWQPIGRLKEQLAREEAAKGARKRAERIERAPDLVVPPRARIREAVGIVMLMALSTGGVLWLRRAERDKEMGKPCRIPEECHHGAACMLSMGPDRTLQPEGFCTFSCSDSSDCKGSMVCGESFEVGPQGARWDGMMGKSGRVCQKRR